VVSVHNLVLDESAGRAAPVLRWLEGLLPSVADRVVALSPAIAERFGQRAVVIPPATDAPRPVRSPAAVRASYGLAAHERLLVAVARLHVQKDLHTLLRAVALLHHVRLVIVGDGPERATLQALSAQLGLTDTVVFAGSRPWAADELAAADVVVVSSLWESGPLVLLEAMQLARPVVTTPVGFAAELVTDGVTGRLVPVGDPAAMAAAVGELLADPRRATALGLAGRARAAERHGPAALAAATEAVYREVLR
jgi:glycosyltransferase involved in cell wall biosynthesis